MSVPRRVLMEHLGVGSGDEAPDAKVIDGAYRVEDDEQAPR